MSKRKEVTFRKPRGSQLAEFGAAFYMLMFALILPAILITKVGVSLIIAQSATAEAASVASKACAFDIAQSQAATILSQLTQSGIPSLLGLKPVSGYVMTGIDMNVDTFNVKDGLWKTSSTNKPLSTKLMSGVSYYYHVTTYLKMPPLIAPNTLVAIPILTRPFTITTQVSKAIEEPISATICLKQFRTKV